MEGLEEKLNIKLTTFEKKLIESTTMTEELVSYYEALAKRKLTYEELNIVALLSNNGIKLTPKFLK